MNFKQILALATVVAATSILSSPDSHADLIITIPDVLVDPGASGFLDVLVSSDGTDSFQNYFLNFSVGGLAHAAAPINLVESAIPAPQLTATDPDYIFLGDSAEAAFPVGIDFVSDSPGSPVANDQINVIDGTDSFANRTIALADGNFLLARLNFVAPLSATPGSVYDISLDFGDFQDSADMSRGFSSNVGSITINAAAVPEPSSIALLAIGSLTLFARRFRRRKTSFSVKRELSVRNSNGQERKSKTRMPGNTVASQILSPLCWMATILFLPA